MDRDTPGELDTPRKDDVETSSSLEILIVDDDQEMVALVAEALTEDGYRVRAAYDGAEALRLIGENPPDVAIVDLMLPDVDGAEICSTIRGRGELEGTRILVLSGADEARIVAANCDADSAVVKPFTLSLLKHELRRLVGQ